MSEAAVKTKANVPMAGDPAPWFYQRTSANPRFAFSSSAGRYIALCFCGSTDEPQSRVAISAALTRTDLFDDNMASFFTISNDPGDQSAGRLANRTPGFRVCWDFD